MINTKLNKTDYILIGIYAFILILINIYDYSINYDTTKYIFPDGSITQNTVPPLKGYLVAIPVEILCTFSVVFLLFLWIIPTFLIKRRNYFIFFGITILVTTAFGILHFTTWRWAENKPWETYPTIFNTLLSGLGLSAENAGMLLGILLAKKYFEAQVHILQIQKKQRESELKLLQAQLSPHFLFNNLNTLDALVDSKPEKAKKYISNLSSLYRYLIKSKDEEMVSLQDEIAMIQNYFYLIETRFGDAYIFKINKQINLNDSYLPTGALQILIENVVKHNKIVNEIPITTTIEVQETKIVVTNNKTETSKKTESFGTGLKNLKERYQLIFDKEILIIDNEQHFQVILPLITLIKN